MKRPERHDQSDWFGEASGQRLTSLQPPFGWGMGNEVTETYPNQRAICVQPSSHALLNDKGVVTIASLLVGTGVPHLESP